MNHDLAHKAFRLRGLALALERGDCDWIFAEAEVPIAPIRADIVQFLRQLGDDIERGARE